MKLFYFALTLTVFCLHNTAYAQTTARNKVQPTAMAQEVKPSKAGPQKFSSNGADYFTAPAPEWVLPAPEYDLLAPRSGPWQYQLIDSQTLQNKSQRQEYTHIIRRVNEASGLAEAAQIELQFDPSYEKITLHELVIKRKNQVLNRLQQDNIVMLRREKQLESSIYDGKYTLSIVLSAVEVGDRIEYRFTLEGQNPVFGQHILAIDHPQASKAHTDTWRKIITVPVGSKVNYKFPKGVLSEQIKTTTGLEQYTFSANNQAKLDLSDRTTIAEILGKFMQVSDFSTWQEVRQWGQQLFELPPPSPAVTALATELRGTHALQSEEAALAALSFVQKEIRYFGIFLGQSSHRPNAPDLILSRRYGDCKDKSMLLMALLKSMGFNPYTVLVHSQYRDQVNTMLPTPFAFDHAIVGVEIKGKKYWLDGTRVYGAGQLENRQSWRFISGLELTHTATQMSAAPARPESDFDMQVTDFVDLPLLKEPAKVRSEIRLRGDLADKVQALLNSPMAATARESLFAPLERGFRQTKVTSPFDTKTDPETGEFLVTQAWEISDYLKLNEKDLLFLEAPAWSLLAELRAPTNAQADWPIENNKRFIHLTQMTFPETFTKEDSTKTERVDDPAFALSREISMKGKTVSLRVDYHTKAIVVNKNRIEEYGRNVTSALNKSITSISLNLLTELQTKDFQARVRYLGNQIDSKVLKAISKNQVSARFDYFLSNMVLEADKLPPKARARYLIKRGIAAGHVNNLQSALIDLDNALKIDPTAYEALLAKARIYWSLGNFQDMLSSANLAKDKTGVDQYQVAYMRGLANFSLGRYVEAKDDFLLRAKAVTGEDREFTAIWLYHTHRRLGKSHLEAGQEIATLSTGTNWPAPLLQYLINQLSEDQLLNQIRNVRDESTRRSQLCEAHYVLGMRKLVDGDKNAATKHFEKSIDTEIVEFIEYRGAEHALKNLGVRFAQW